MTLNPFVVFQKNKRLWMALILMICMISFVFCTGTKGDVGELVTRLLGKRGTGVASINGRNITREDLFELKQQRAIANELLHRCTEQAFNMVSKELFELGKQQPGAAGKKEDPKRGEKMVLLTNMQRELHERKSRSNYFDTGTKFEDLIDFKLWQAQADKMGIYLEDEHITHLFRLEYFYHLDPQEVLRAIYEVKRNHREASDSYIRRALGEEFRVKIAQLAVMGSQPFSFYTRRNAPVDSLDWKFSDPDFPDQIRTPLTLGQLYDVYKSKRAEGEVVLIPVPVEKFAKEMPEPGDIEKRKFFADNKGKAFDPAAGDTGLDIPQQIKIEYLTADPNSPQYLNTAKVKQLLEVFSPLTWSPHLAFDPLQLPVVMATQYLVEKERFLQPQYDRIGASRLSDYRMPPYIDGDINTPLLAWFARQQPEAAASFVAASALATSPVGFMAMPQAAAGYLAFGAQQKYEDAIVSGQHAELRRRAPLYGDVLRLGLSPLQPFDVLGPVAILQQAPPMLPLELQQKFNHFMSRPLGADPLLPVEVVQQELRDMRARRQAEDWARERMQIVREALDPEKIQGDDQKFKRVLDKYVSLYHLQYGPSAQAKATYFDRYSIETDKNKDFEPLKKACEKVMTQINFFEGRDPDKQLKEKDFYKLFFNAGEPFAATTPYQVKPWPPTASPNIERTLLRPNRQPIQNLTLTQEAQIGFINQMKASDPTREPAKLDLFVSADQPFLFWRTAQFDPPRPSEYDQIQSEINTAATDLKKVQADIAALPKDRVYEFNLLMKKEADLKETEVCLKKLQKRIDEGWKYQQARTTKALPQADIEAKKIIESINDPVAIREAAARLGQKIIVIPRVTDMYTEDPLTKDFVSYSEFPLPLQDELPYPRDDTAKKIASLYGLKKPFEFKDEQLDKKNLELFKLVTDKKGKPDHFVQILTNIPKSVYYIAVVTKAPKAEPFLFHVAMRKGGDFPPRDMFASRVQQDAARAWRIAVVRDDLKHALNYKLLNEDAQKDFDGSGG